MRARLRASAEAGQAQLELIALVPTLFAVAAVLIQLMAVGYAQTLADGSAEAAALATASRLPPERAARAALPGWASGRLELDVRSERIEVELVPPTLIPGLGDRLAVRSAAWVRTPRTTAGSVG